jgi:hypothetical protein
MAWLIIRIASLVLIGFGSGSAFAFCFAPQLEVSDEYYVSDLVLLGTVVGSKDLIDTSDPEGALGTYYTVRVDATYRGRRYRSLRIYSENSTARFPMEKGTRYVLFLKRDTQQNWTIDNCGNSGEIVSSSATIQQVMRLPLRQSFVYGEVYTWQNPDKCSPMQLTLRSGKLALGTEVKADCSFKINVPAGRYRAILRRNGEAVVPNDPNYKDAYCFVVPVGGSAGIAFRLADGADKMNRDFLLRSDNHARSLCSKARSPQYLFFY